MDAGTAFTGDLLITFGEDIPRLPPRFPAAPWGIQAQGEGWQLWSCAPCADWKGFPLQTVESGGWKACILGEFRPGDHPPPRLESLARQAAAFHGRYLMLAWDPAERQWHAWTDRFATLHAYHASSGRRAALGTFSPAVAAAASQRSLDWEALAGFFGFGFFPQDRTYFEGVRILRPASHYVLDERGRVILQERAWEWWHAPDYRRSYDDTLAQFAQLLHQVLDEASGEGRVAVPVSGGLDSRSTVAAITRPERQRPAGLSLWAYSYGYTDDSVETRIARRVASARGLPFQAYTIRPYLFERLEQILAWTEGFQEITLARQTFVRDEIAAQAESLIAALWGDVWLDDMGLAGKPAQGLDDAAIQQYALAKMRKRGGDWLLERLAAPQLPGTTPAELLHSMVREELRPLAQIADPDFRLKAFKTEQWSFRWSLSPIRVFQSAAAPRLVFYDARLADFFCTVPSEYVAGRRLQIDYLKRYSPDLARLPWQVYDADLFTYRHFNTWLLPRRALKKAWRLISGQKVIERNWEVQFLCESGRRGLQRWLLRPGLRLHEFIAPNLLAELLEAFYRPPLDPRRGYTLAMLLTFSAWLERYG
jgi:hypothetical protein